MSKQTDLFSLQERFEELASKKDPLQKLNFIDWEMFRPILKKVVKKKKGEAGRKPYDPVLKFKILILQKLYDLSDEQTEFQIKDRLSFMRFLGLDIHDSVPDENTIRHFREQLIEHGLIRKLFDRFNSMLETKGLISKQGTMIDASIVDVPVQRNSREENKRIKQGETPEDWHSQPAKLAQKDTDARWTKKNQKAFFGYKNHVRGDKKSKLIQDYKVTDASVHDSQVCIDLLKTAKGQPTVFADSAYSIPTIMEYLQRRGWKVKICAKGVRNKPLTEAQKKQNRKISKTRARVEHIFGDINHFRGNFVRLIGMKRCRASIGMTNLVYNIRRYLVIQGVTV